MEIIVFLAMMIVPIISIVSLAIAISASAKVKNLKSLFLSMAKTGNREHDAMASFKIMDA